MHPEIVKFEAMVVGFILAIFITVMAIYLWHEKRQVPGAGESHTPGTVVRTGWGPVRGRFTREA